MTILNDAILRFVGVASEDFWAQEPVEAGAVRRFSQAVMDADPAYWQEDAAVRYGGPVAPPLYPIYAFRREFGTPDVLEENAEDPNYDGASGGSIPGLPEITAFRGFGILNGGSEIEIYRYARMGDHIRMRSRYESIFEKETSKGPMVFILIVTDYLNDTGDLLLTVKRTTIRRPV